MNVGQTIRKHRKQIGLTLKELSELTGISISFLSDIERGRRNPSIENAILIAKSLSFDASIIIPNDIKHILKSSDYNAPHQDIKASDIELSKKDSKDIAKDLNATLSQLEHSQDGLMFDGEPIDDETRELLKISLENSMRLAKQIAKKYTPNKYKK